MILNQNNSTQNNKKRIHIGAKTNNNKGSLINAKGFNRKNILNKKVIQDIHINNQVINNRPGQIMETMEYISNNHNMERHNNSHMISINNSHMMKDKDFQKKILYFKKT